MTIATTTANLEVKPSALLGMNALYVVQTIIV
jgi:hypothetical protein